MDKESEIMEKASKTGRQKCEVEKIIVTAQAEGFFLGEDTAFPFYMGRGVNLQNA